ncbi:MAG: precorrin-4 C(11)-methyltransferase [Actinobacteria bacterium]|nr:precorrin-4 C(11)-methyltransferase [Actinomycetota bacterium]
MPERGPGLRAGDGARRRGAGRVDPATRRPRRRRGATGVRHRPGRGGAGGGPRPCRKPRRGEPRCRRTGRLHHPGRPQPLQHLPSPGGGGAPAAPGDAGHYRARHHGLPGRRRPHGHDHHRWRRATGGRECRRRRRRRGRGAGRRNRSRRHLQGRAAPARDRRPPRAHRPSRRRRPRRVDRAPGRARRCRLGFRGPPGRLPGHRGGSAEAAGVISFVGAGPGAADLVTLRGRDRLAAADVVVWASSLVPEELLVHASPDALVLDSAPMTLEDVVAVYAAHPHAAIVRLHSGDPSVYGAIQEQIDWCLAEERDFEIVPGVSSVSAAAAAVRRELTIPKVAQSVVLTRLAGRTAASMPAGESVSGFASSGATMAVFLSAARPQELQQELLAAGSAYDADTPAAIVVRATWPDEQVVMTTVGRLAVDLDAVGARTTVLVLVGPALAGAAPRSHLYSPDYAHGFRRRSVPGTTTGRPA